MDLNKMVVDALNNIQASGLVEKKVQERIEQAIESIVNEIFSGYGDFGKALKEKVKAELQINLDQLQLQSYNTLILKAISEKIDEVVTLQGIEQIKAGLKDMLTIERKEIKLSELVNQLKEDALESDDDLRGKNLSLHVDKKFRYLTFISFDENSDKQEGSCRYKITVGENGELRSLGIGDREITKRMLMKGFYGFEEELFKLFASGSTLIVDEDDVDTYYSEED